MGFLNKAALMLLADSLCSVKVAANPFLQAQHHGKKIISHSNGGVSIKLTKDVVTSRNTSTSKRLGDKRVRSGALSDAGEDSHYQLDLTNDMNMAYYGPVYLGSPGLQEVQVVYDTGSDWLVVEGKNCETCQGNSFDNDSSQTFKQVATEESERNYGSASLTGVEATDRICLTDNGESGTYCLAEFEWFLIEKQRGLGETLDGVLGLCRSKYQEDDRETGPLMAKLMYENGILEENVFAFYMESYENELAHNLTSFIDFGKVQHDHYKGQEEDIVWINLVDHFFWISRDGYGVRFGDDQEGAFNFGSIQRMPVIFDTGTSLTLVPQSIYKAFVSQLGAKVQGEPIKVDGPYIFGHCDHLNYPPVYLMVGVHWLEFAAIDYVIKPSNWQEGDACFIGFMKSPEEFWLLGDTFFRGYYTIHNDDQNKVGVMPHATSTKSRPEFHTYLPTQELTEFYEWTTSMIIITVIAVILVVTVIVLFFVYVWPVIWEWIHSSGKPATRNYDSSSLIVLQLDK